MVRLRLLRLFAVPATLALVAACSAGASPSPATPSPDPAPEMTAAPATEAPPASEPAAEETEAAGGLPLADADVAALISAYENYGFTFDDPGTNDAGENVHIGYTEDEQVFVRITETENTISEVLVVDYSAGEEGLEEMGFTIGIFEPDAQDWLVGQLEQAIGEQGTPMTATMEFENVTLQLEAFTDEEQSIDLYVSEG
jgi:hypothetical protein